MASWELPRTHSSSEARCSPCSAPAKPHSPRLSPAYLTLIARHTQLPTLPASSVHAASSPHRQAIQSTQHPGPGRAARPGDVGRGAAAWVPGGLPSLGLLARSPASCRPRRGDSSQEAPRWLQTSSLARPQVSPSTGSPCHLPSFLIPDPSGFRRATTEPPFPPPFPLCQPATHPSSFLAFLHHATVLHALGLISTPTQAVLDFLLLCSSTQGQLLPLH